MWHELMGWVDVMSRQIEGEKPDPFTWGDRDSEHWREIHRKAGR